MSLALAIVGFAALIVLHELGHFAVAKAVGMRVERFSLFFGPMIVRRRVGETVYGIGVVPLGGYVKITGMSPREAIPPEVLSRAYYLQPVWKRVAVILAGPGVNLIIAFALLTAIVWSAGYNTGSLTVVQKATAAPAAGALRPGDRLLSADGRPIATATDLARIVASHRCAAQTAGCAAATPVRLFVRRDRARVALSLVPRYDAAAGKMRLGVELEQYLNAFHHAAGLGDAAGRSLEQMWFVTHKTITTFATLFEPKVRQQVHGVVGVVDVTRQRFDYSTTEALYTLAIVSLSLAVVNLFPFLPLDGGHVFWALAERVRGRRIPFEVMERAGAIGFVLIVMIFLIGFTNDVSTLSGKGFTR